MECKKNIRQRDFCLTIFNTDWYDKYAIHQLLDDWSNGKIKYFVMGNEICPTTNKRHIQGYIYWKDARTFSAVKKDFPDAHIEARLEASSPEKAAQYCKKENNWVERGDLPVDKRGKVNEWKEITTDIQEGMSYEDLTLKYPEAAIRYNAGVRNMYELHRPKHKFSILDKYGKYNDIQQYIMDYVAGPTHDRQIFWVYDPKGGCGKTDLANHLICNEKFLVLGNAKTADVALAWNGENVIFDYSRSQESHINYEVMEALKNGRIFSGKYNSCVKIYARPKVLVFANFLPADGKMSEDKWFIHKVENGKIFQSAAADY